MNTLLLVSNGLARLCNGVGRMASWLLIPLMLVIVTDVILRRFYTIGSIRLQELEWHLHAALFMLCLGYAYLANAHVRIELVRERFTSRTKAAIEIIGLIGLFLPLAWILIDYSANLVLRSYAVGERSPHASGLEYRWLIKLVMPVGFTVLALSTISLLLRAIVLLFGSPELRARASTPVLPSDAPDAAPSETR